MNYYTSKSQIDFKYFLLNENKEYFGQKVNNILTAISDIQDEVDQIGSRHLTRIILSSVNAIRQVLHSSWNIEQRANLEQLQKIGVALMKCIDEKGDAKEVLTSCQDELQDIMAKLGVPQNKLGSGLVEKGTKNAEEPEEPRGPEGPGSAGPPGHEEDQANQGALPQRGDSLS